ncbi:MAG: calcium-translocating P-type ATPase, PMCA-type, partial [Clostridia bacterium]|nr:calcium-translocating P-type ATPase, PMCA-type [Clostridia bacterium]
PHVTPLVRIYSNENDLGVVDIRATVYAGLSEAEVAAARQAHGENVLSRKKKKGFIRQFVGNLGDPIIKVLLCALGIHILLMFRQADWFETVGIAVSVFLATLISTVSEYGSEAAFARLSESCGAGACRVRREGKVKQVAASEIVVGDVVLLQAGDMIPADGRMLTGRLRVDQSGMTGESAAVQKAPGGGERTPHNEAFVFGGCTVLQGEGEMLVEAVGDATFLGGISTEVQSEVRDSPLKVRLGKLAGQISRLGYTAAVLVAVVYLLNSFVLDAGFDGEIILHRLRDWQFVLEHLFRALTLGLSVVVMAVPEGLPMMIAVVLSSNVKRMVRDNVLVRKPAGIEAAGSMNILFTDKTGTLTHGKMRATELVLGTGETVRLPLPLHDALAEQYRRACLCNTSAQAEQDASTGRVRALGGNATDRALFESALTDPKVLPTAPECAVWRLPFESERKYAAALVGGTVQIKGAPERILPYVKRVLDAQGREVTADAAALRALAQKPASEGKRVLALAYCREGGTQASYAAGAFGALVLIGFVLLEDGLRREAPRAVADLRGAGVQVVMITGDGKETAEKIARACGILGGGVDVVLEGSELAAMSDDKVRALLPRIGVVARAMPADKSRLVRLAQQLDLVVGMTGDGINDAPALRASDVGFAMGDGTQVAREAGDIILLDNNLASVVNAVLYGRTVFKSIRKFIVLQLTMNFCAVGVSMLGPFLGFDAPVTVVQMLWINMIMDTLGGLAFAGEAPKRFYLKEAPKKRDEPILNGYMIFQIIWQGLATVGVCLCMLVVPAITGRFRAAPDDIYLLTAFFALFIFMSVCNCFGARTDRLRLFAGIGKNPGFIGIMLAVTAIQIAFVYLGGSVLRTAPLTPAELGFTFSLALLAIPTELLRKIIWRLCGKKTGY